MNEFVIHLTVACLLAVAKTKQMSGEDQYNEIDKIPFNVTHVILQSVLFCGTDILDDKSVLTSLNIPDNLNVPRRCPDCFYDECPDYFFKYGYLQCKDLNISRKGPGKSSLVIASCPEGANTSLVEKCMNNLPNTDYMSIVPVLGLYSVIVYQNKFCALCNQEYEYENFWLDFKCPEPVDFNFFSTPKELLLNSEKNFCNQSFSIWNLTPKDCEEPQNKVTSCNVTGTWRYWDIQIEKACKSGFEKSYGAFKNIFCAMCNPPKFDQTIFIDSCVYQNIQAEFCRNQSILEASFPYKNYFCIGCNDFSLDNFYDVILTGDEEIYIENDTLPFEVTIYFSYSKEHIIRIINQTSSYSTLKTSIPNRNENNHSTLPNETELAFKEEIIQLPNIRYFCSNDSHKNDTFTLIQYRSNTPYFVNVTKLVYASFAMTKYGACTAGLLPPYTKLLQRNCSCVIGCTSQCCDDFALQQSWACIGIGFLGAKEDANPKYRAISGCPYLNKFQNFCSDKNSTDLFYNIPVSAVSEFKETYVNIFCYICGKMGNQIDTISGDFGLKEVFPWPLKFKCKDYVNYRHFRYIQELVKYLQKSECILSIMQGVYAKKCIQDCEVDISICNVTGSWQTFDEDILTACEYSDILTFPRTTYRSLIFKNRFCVICNPLNVNNLKANHTCNEENDPNLVKACQEFPAIYACSDFKNVFCEECQSSNASKCTHAIQRDIPSETDVPMDESKDVFWSFLFTFSLSSYSETDILTYELNQLQCFSNQIYDKYYHTCRDVTCFPGKYLNNGTCVSLLSLSKNLRYTLALKIKFRTLTKNNDPHEILLQNLRDQIVKSLVNMISDSLYIEDLYLMSLYTCDAVNVRNGELQLYVTIFAKWEIIKRDEIEEKLIQFTEATSTWTLHDHMNVIVTMSRDESSLLLPYLSLKLNEKKTCFVMATQRQVGIKVYRNVVVAPLLTCQQIALQGYEFGIDWKNMQYEYSFLDFSISISKFHTYADGVVRLCVNDIKMYIQMLEQEHLIHENPTLSFLTLTFICVSLFFLFLTFLTYCAFPSLRTLPGINNMILVIFLFLAQLCLVVRPLLRSVAMTVASVVSHFFWLSTFFWLQVCSFHMYRVFNAENRKVYSKTYMQKTIFKYVSYATGIPFAIVGSNIVVSLMLTKGEYTGYDRMMTLMTSKTAFIVTMITPLTVVCLTNIVFYVLTAYKIFSVPIVDGTIANRNYFAVYVKLFTITGLTWFLQIIDTFLGLSVLSYVIAILNGLQGFFLFVSYVYNGRVFNLYRRAFNCLSNSKPGPKNKT